MKKNYLKLFFLAFFCCCFTTNSIADPNIKRVPKKPIVKKKLIFRKGSIYVLATQKYLPILYTRKYVRTGKNIYTTSYSIYTEQKRNKGVIEAVHNKKTHNIDVSIRDYEISGNPIVNSERTSYTVPYMGRFGSIGKIGAMASGKARTTAPGQITVKFVSKKFDYIKVVHIADNHEDEGKTLQVYVLDEGAQ